jgi:hypothetical protein
MFAVQAITSEAAALGLLEKRNFCLSRFMGKVWI